MKTIIAYFAHVKFIADNQIGWADVSDIIERIFLMTCTRQNLINPDLYIKYNAYNNFGIDGDDYHYYRWDVSCKRNVKKICYGYIEIGR